MAQQKVAIFLRRSASINRFRGVIEGCLQVPSLTEAVIASGFFQERANFSAAQIFNALGRRGSKPLELIFVGVYNGHWVPQFDKFVSLVKTGNSTRRVTVRKRRMKGLRWHAKVFVGSVQGVPCVAVVGSSNMTRPAADTTKPFNYEADVVLWDESFHDVNSAISGQIENIAGDHEVIVTTYEPGGANGSLTLEERLVSLRNEILGSSTEV
jgi:hypothetical protein